MDGQMGGRMDGWIDGKMDGQTMDGCMMGGWIDGTLDGQTMDGQVEGWTDRRLDEWIAYSFHCTPIKIIPMLEGPFKNLCIGEIKSIIGVALTQQYMCTIKTAPSEALLGLSGYQGS